MLFQPTTDDFIGREKEIEHFKAWLASPTSPWILYFHDALEDVNKKGGVGKTWLLRRCADVAKQELQATVVMIDFFNIADRDGIAVAEYIVAELQTTYPEWAPQAFTTTLQEYHLPVSNESIDAENFKLKISDALTTDLHMLDEQLRAKNRYLLVFFDTFEVIEQNPTIAVLYPSQTFPDNYRTKYIRVVMAGRNALDWTQPNWLGREQEVEIVALAPFSRQEMVHYLDMKSVYSLGTQQKQAIALYERTNGRPILLGLVKDILNQRILTLDELVVVPQANFESYLVALINRLENPLNWIILFMAHVYHHFNVAILEWIMRALDMQELAPYVDHKKLLVVLPTLSFVRYPGYGTDFVLHDEMRRLVVKYCWDIQDPNQSIRKEISRHMVSYCEQEMAQVPNERQQRYIIEILYHRLVVDPNDGMSYFRQQFLDAIRFLKNALARLLLQEVQKFVEVLSLAQLNESQYSEATLLRSEESPAVALSILQQLKLEADPDWYTEYQSSVLIEEGRCYSQQSKLPEATTSYIQALHIEQERGGEIQSAQLLSSLGGLYRRRGQFSISLDYYEKSITVYKKLGRQHNYATALTNIGIVYLNQGKMEEALLRCKVALHILFELFRDGKISEILIGTSLRTLGQIYLDAGNITEAEHNFQRAFDVYLRMSFKRGIATMYNRFGWVQLLKGDLEGAQVWFVKAEEASYGIEIEQYINSLNKQGRICTLQNKWEEAALFFERAIPIAQSVPDYYQQTENLIDLADTLERLKQSTHAQQLLHQAEEIAIRENYLFLLGLIERTRAEIDYRTGVYKTAFQHYALYCHYMAQYNVSEFSLAVQKVIDALLDAPRHAVLVLVQELLAYWTEHQLDKSYPDLIQMLENVNTLMEEL